MRKFTVYQMTTCAIFVALMCIFGPLSIPIGPIPVSFTVLTIFLAIMLIGTRLSLLSYGIYLIMGAIGLPVFSGFQGGIGKLLGPTGGYLIGFIPMIVVSGLIVYRFSQKVIPSALSMILGVVIAYVFGTAWFVISLQTDIMYALTVCVFPFIPFDLAKIAIAIILGKVIRSALIRAGLIPVKAGPSKKVLQAYLSKDAGKFYHIKWVKVIDSTNNAAKKAAENSEPEGYCVIANTQTAGRGRQGRDFFSPKSGIYLSIVLRPDMLPKEAAMITPMAAVAAARACEDINTSLSPGEVGIKWVNDIILRNRKISGILTEAELDSTEKSLKYVVLGIGFNISMPGKGWPGELMETAGGLFTDEIPAYSKLALASAFLNHFYGLYRELPNKIFVSEYRDRSVLIGKDVDIIDGAGVKPAQVTGIDDDFHLLVRFEGDSTDTALDSGEVRVRV